MGKLIFIIFLCVLPAVFAKVDEVHSVNFTLVSSLINKKLIGFPVESYLYFTNLVQHYGYKGMQYKVTTEDGYILTLFRMQSKNCKKLKKVPLMLSHGTLMNGETWLIPGPQTGLPYLIADACYDLWVTNARGTDYGREHVHLNPDRDAEFWDFTLHEMGVYDHPAVIDFILSKTKVKKLNFFGFSAGGGNLFVTLSERPEYADKINFAITIAPGVRLENMISIALKTIFTVVGILQPLLNVVGIYELFSKGSIIQVVLEVLCSPVTFPITRLLCQRITELDSYHPTYLTDTTHEVYNSKFFRGVSVKAFAHYYQILDSGYFRQYDHGEEENLLRYNSVTPPLYKIKNFKVPVLVLRGIDDEIITDIDLRNSIKDVPNIIAYKNITIGNWNHVNTIGHTSWPIVFNDINNNYLSPYSSL